tara:strand:+ start:523 stop:2055 length:1533 start_codon:yes stop_codon:yes gene_type:complete
MELCDEYLQQLLIIDPTIHDFLSTTTYPKHIQPNVYSESYYVKTHKLNQEFLKRIHKQPKQTRYDKLLKHNIEYSIHIEDDYEIYMYIPIDLYHNKLIDYVTECSGNGYYQFKQPSDYKHFMKRLKTLTPMTDEIILKMRSGIKHKVSLYKKIVDAMIEQIQTVLKTKSYHQKSVSFKKKWDQCIQTYLVSNLERLLSFLLTEYYPYCSNKCGLHSYKKGKQYYKGILHNEIYQKCSPESVHKFGKQELKRLLKEKKRLSLEKPKSPYTNKQQILQELQRIQIKVKQMNQKHFDKSIKNYQIRSVPKESEHSVAYYERSTKHKKGTFYINTSDLTKWNPYELLVLSLHEGFPGHHYELEYHKQKQYPRYMKLWMNRGYSEGWAFYSENLYPYKDDHYYFYKLEYDILRTLRLIIDTGIHYFGWDYEKCFQYMKENSSMTDEIIHKELIRYLCLPGQALSYKIGGTIFLYLRKLCIDKGYTLKQFHKLVLSLGPCYLEDLVSNVHNLLEIS